MPMPSATKNSTELVDEFVMDDDDDDVSSLPVGACVDITAVVNECE